MRKNLAWLLTSLACAAYFTPPPPTIFSVDILNCFTQERITLDCNYHFRIQGRDCCGSYEGEGDLSPEEAQQFLADFRNRYTSLPSRPVGEVQPFEVFQGEGIFWKGEWTRAERDWFGHTWCSREQQKLPRPELSLEI